ncbi:DUF927 domain-containing protein [Sporosarcina limicola]|uniref:Uncharacterized protein (DUF927 family) n=1 Tax=Sporosarcina limicola TaxID=34101 RepID=A0A927MME2_9BACL|nr:DUF927 domain-containing protein [Sporosarcina limicola]MBE1557005.1 uncharacterized protein (DUF927 family) [Sporosarcina limicola]
MTTISEEILDPVEHTQPQFERIPAELKALDQWVAYKLVWDEKNKKFGKPPYSLDGTKKQGFDIHYSFEQVKAAVEAGAVHGAGFALTSNDNFICFDLDGDSLDSIPASIKSISEHSYAEISPSGTGLHVWFKGNKPKGAGGKQNRYTVKEKYKVECFYGTGFLTMTGNAINALPLEENQMILNYIYDNTTHGSEIEDPIPIVDMPIPEDEKDDAVVITKMFNSRSGEKIKALFNGDTSFHDGDDSAADISLLNYLAIHTRCNAEQMDRIFRTTKLFRDKWDVVHHSDGSTYGTETIRRAITWAYPKVMESVGMPVEDGTEYWMEDARQVIIPEPYLIEFDTLKKKVLVKEGGLEFEKSVIVCRHSPIITQSFSNVEQNQIYHEIQWKDDGREYRETIPAGDISTRNKLLQLADKSLGVHDLNVKDLINFFDKYIMYNNISRTQLVTRLGHIKRGFVHPSMPEIKILPPDLGDKQTLEAFQVNGTAESWINEVFRKIQAHPKAVLMVVAAFTSVILKDLKLGPFIIDLSGPTSKGKSTVSKIAASVWGTSGLVSEWNMTKVALERKAAFLNSFPIIADDSQKGDPRQLKDFIYNFSGGRSKGRGSLTGTQTEYTWNNIMLSNGESSLLDFAIEAGGAAARVLPVKGLPFGDADYNFFNEIYTAIENNHGAIGIEFHKKWSTEMGNLTPIYQTYNDHFQKKSNGNDVLSRIARHYSALVFTADVLNKTLNMNIDLDALLDLFDEMVRENTAIDKPMEMLHLILSDLDSDRQSIFGEFIPNGTIKALYRDKTLILLPNYLKEFLKTEQKAIRSEWLRRDISISSIRNSKEVDTKQYKHKGENFSGLAIKPEIVEELGFNFESDSKR